MPSREIIRDNKWWVLYTHILAALLSNHSGDPLTNFHALLQEATVKADQAWLFARGLPTTDYV